MDQQMRFRLSVDGAPQVQAGMAGVAGSMERVDQAQGRMTGGAVAAGNALGRLAAVGVGGLGLA
ncbi:MAG: hypothetical protein J0M00_20160, partial [Burkholderiales bacterium]|nr:hypothetical protein [Burkholderiales bacterium]